MKYIEYKKDYKYQLFKEYTTNIQIKQDNDIKTNYIKLSPEGIIVIKKGYAWDGPSGPAIDTLNFMRGSLVHDALYQLMRNDELDKVKFKDSADRLLQRMCKEDGMSSLRAWGVYQALKYTGNKATHSKNKKPVINAPKPCQNL
ncbi:MAG: hypothetical protein GXP08_08360 [Gammaproteobacteria bacterium]|nr:hypothetical protein [Gammaproteobacteria bacterium]